MKTRIALLLLFGLVTTGCGNNPDEIPRQLFNSNAIYVANEGSSSISAFQLVGPSGAGPVDGSPFRVNAPPTALGGNEPSDLSLLVASESGKTISMFSVDLKTSVLRGPLFTVTTPFTPKGVAAWRDFFYVANAEGNVSAFRAPRGGAPTEVPGSPFPAGAGPVSLAAAEPGLLYVANSLSDDVSGFVLDASGVPTPLPGSPFPAGDAPAWVDVQPPFFPNALGGPTLVFVANARSNSISVYSIATNGSLVPAPGSPFAAGAAPSSIGIGNALPLKFVYVANSQSNTISGYKIDPATGALTPLAGSPFPAGLNPVSVAVAINRAFLYVANAGSNNLSVFQIDNNTGALTPVSGSPFKVGTRPRAVLFFQVAQ